jgi:hypothetical protein
MDQNSQQNIVELLFLSLYQDNHLSLDEDSMLQKALKELGWKEHEESGPSVGKAFSAIREASICEADTEKFLVDRARAIKEAGHSLIAFEWLGKVLGSDGLDDRESRFLERARQYLFD